MQELQIGGASPPATVGPSGLKSVSLPRCGSNVIKPAFPDIHIHFGENFHHCEIHQDIFTRPAGDQAATLLSAAVLCRAAFNASPHHTRWSNISPRLCTRYS